MFTSLRTDRLVIRAMEPGDVEALHRRRNEPDVARYQNWTVPYPLERAGETVAEVVAMGGPLDGEWWMATVTDLDGEILGDLVVHLANSCRTAEIGYSFASAHWGFGYAVEAVDALIRWLFDTYPLTRVFGMLHPDNVASAQVLERTGLVFEGLTRLSFWLGDDNSDDALYGMTRDDWERWDSRPRHRPGRVELVGLTPTNLDAVLALATHRSQQRFVASVAESLADALVPEQVDGATVVPWYRAIEADGELAGFVMLAEPTDRHPEPYLWRLLIDRMHQRRGVAGLVLDQVLEVCRSWGAATLLTTWVPGRGTPEPFYLARGFVPTGRVVDDEIEARLTL